MYAYTKNSLPGSSLKFGVTNHGVIVPMLPRGKDVSLRHELLVRPLRLGLKWAPRSR
jgi:hypothetical protein